MKRIIEIVMFIIFMLFAANVAMSAGTCTQKVEKNGAQATLTFVCTADAAAHSYPSTAVSSANWELIKGYWVDSIKTTPGGTAPTNSTAVAFNTGDSAALDIFGGRAVCSSTVTKTFKPVVDSTTTMYGGFTLTSAPSLVITGNSVNSAIITAVITLWNN